MSMTQGNARDIARGIARRIRRPGLTTTVRVVGLLLLLGAPTVWIAAGMPGTSAPEFGSTAALLLEPEDGPAAQEPADGPAAPDAAVGNATPSAEIPVNDTPSPFTTTAPRGIIDPSTWPSALAIPALGVSAPVEAVGVSTEGELIIPASPMDVGWYQGGSVPGEPGVALLTSHLDTRAEGRGVLAGLVRLAEGDDVLVTSADGSVQRWTVVARTQHRKDQLPVELFSRAGEPVLALVTCGGPFDTSIRSYQDNVIVWARPAA